MYGDFMGTGSASYLFAPYGRVQRLDELVLAGRYQGVVDGGCKRRDGKVQRQRASSATTRRHMLPSRPSIVAGTVSRRLHQLDLQGIQWGGFTPGSIDPRGLRLHRQSERRLDPDVGILATVDHELLPDFSLGLNVTYRKYDHFSWDPAYIQRPLRRLQHRRPERHPATQLYYRRRPDSGCVRSRASTWARAPGRIITS